MYSKNSDLDSLSKWSYRAFQKNLYSRVHLYFGVQTPVPESFSNQFSILSKSDKAFWSYGL